MLPINKKRTIRKLVQYIKPNTNGLISRDKKENVIRILSWCLFYDIAKESVSKFYCTFILWMWVGGRAVWGGKQFFCWKILVKRYVKLSVKTKKRVVATEGKVRTTSEFMRGWHRAQYCPLVFSPSIPGKRIIHLLLPCDL